MAPLGPCHGCVTAAVGTRPRFRAPAREPEGAGRHFTIGSRLALTAGGRGAGCTRWSRAYRCASCCGLVPREGYFSMHHPGLQGDTSQTPLVVSLPLEEGRVLHETVA